MLIRKIATIALAASMTYGCMTKMNNHELNDKELSEISSKVPAADYKKNLNIRLNLSENSVNKETLSVGKSTAMNYLYLGFYESAKVIVNLDDLTNAIIVNGFKDNFSAVDTNIKKSAIQPDYLCDVDINNDYNVKKRTIGALILANEITTNSKIAIVYRVSCKSSLYPPVSFSLPLNIINNNNVKQPIQESLKTLKTNITSSFPVSTTSFLANSVKPEQFQNVTQKISVKSADQTGNTALHYAVINKDLKMTDMLISAGADVNAVNIYGKTPLHYAAQYFNKDIYADLIAKGARPDIKDKDHISPEYMLAMQTLANYKNDHILNDEIVINSKPVYSQFASTTDIANGKDPFSNVQETVKKRLNFFLSMGDNPISIPDEIKKPLLPEPVKLVQGQFESTKTFKGQVQNAELTRKQDITALQLQYRNDVERRNSLIVQKEELAAKRLYAANAIKEIFIYDAMNQVFGKFYLDNPKYNADKELMYVTLKSSLTDYSRTVALKVPEGETAKSFYNNISKLPVEATFQYNGGTLSLSGVSAAYNSYTACADMNSGEYIKPEQIEVVVSNTAKIQDESQLQNPNLIDSSGINIVVYEKQKENFNDDLPEMLNNAKGVAPDNKKWLVAIGVENYDNTDRVSFSARSAEMFTRIAQKMLGVPGSHVYTAIGDKATAGTIKNDLTWLTKNVQEGDTVYFYYSGHGIPVLPDKEPYILPKDIVPDFVNNDNSFKLQNIYATLSASKAKNVIAFVDSCFSGVTDGESVFKGVAASRLQPKQITFDQDKMVVLTAGSDKQFSNMYQEKGHRLFSYFVMKSILNGRNDIKTLYNEVAVEVKDQSFAMGGDNREQDPALIGNSGIKLK